MKRNEFALLLTDYLKHTKKNFVLFSYVVQVTINNSFLYFNKEIQKNFLFF
jgi:hypothetical protein